MKKEEFIYKTVNGIDLKLHIFWPENRCSKVLFPAIVFFSGGGWIHGGPERNFQLCEYYASKNMVGIAADYRVKSRHGITPFECVEDGKSAIRWVREHAAELEVDQKKVVAAGSSAGGHVAASTVMIKDINDPHDNLLVSSVPDALVLFNPAVDLSDITISGHGAERLTEEEKKKLSPLYHVIKGLPPTVIFHGTADHVVPFNSVAKFTEAMKEAENICQLVPFEGVGHGLANSTGEKDHKSYDETLRITDEFLTSIFIFESDINNSIRK